ncbi:MAG: diguanylate phosphodiesterase metal dependent hydrolase domain containing protein [Bryobacterales bacterium]|nr:diguanylate phosphodiesterase metal dependent hydrolase domain containing protein [Bryobacterales bacterium]
MDVFVARQPIFDRQLRVYGYELLSRSCLVNVCQEMDGAAATAQVIANSVLTIGIGTLVGGKRAFVNFDRDVLIGPWTTILPPQTLVVEVLESVELDSEVLEACRLLRKLGYSVALDDFVRAPAYEPLVELANFIKVDFRDTTRSEQERLVRVYGTRGISMLAEKVETQEEFEWAKAMGYAYFQGYFFARPHVVRARQFPAHKLTQLRLMNEVAKSDLDFDSLEKLIRLDVAFAYKILRYINSAAFTWSGSIKSIRQALIMMGENEIRRWISVATLPGLTQGKPDAVAIHAMVRGRFCELIVQHAAGMQASGDPFLLGMFSLLDAMMDRPLTEIVHELSLAPQLSEAILGAPAATNTLAAVLTLVKCYEAAHWEELPSIAALIRLPQEIAPRLYMEAVAWSDEQFRAAAGPVDNAVALTN